MVMIFDGNKQRMSGGRGRRQAFGGMPLVARLRPGARTGGSRHSTPLLPQRGIAPGSACTAPPAPPARRSQRHLPGGGAAEEGGVRVARCAAPRRRRAAEQAQGAWQLVARHARPHRAGLVQEPLGQRRGAGVGSASHACESAMVVVTHCRDPPPLWLRQQVRGSLCCPPLSCPMACRTYPWWWSGSWTRPSRWGPRRQQAFCAFCSPDCGCLQRSSTRPDVLRGHAASDAAGRPRIHSTRTRAPWLRGPRAGPVHHPRSLLGCSPYARAGAGVPLQLRQRQGQQRHH